ncbi:MAG: hypothetical protein JWO36_7415 [Myxococcales bacterium]|nr:hypothetical protein [Myxococcales bacterium]
MNNQNGGSAAKPLKSGVQNLVDRGSDAADSIKVRVVEITDKAKSKGTELYDQIADVVKANPLKAIAIAFGVGYVAMRINTSKLTPLAVIGGLGYLGSRLLRA